MEEPADAQASQPFHQSVDVAKCHPQAALAQVLHSDKGQALLGEPGSLALERL